MQLRLSGKRRHLDFDRNLYTVLCVASAETIRGLQWAADRDELLERRFRFFQASLSDLSQKNQINANDFDLSFVHVDLGQAVPVENLQMISSKPGMCSFFQPTPQQLISVFELPKWSALTWDGVNFAKVVTNLSSLVTKYEKDIQLQRFSEAFSLWENSCIQDPDLLEWTNPPESYAGTTRFFLDKSQDQLFLFQKNNGQDIDLSSRPAGKLLAEVRQKNKQVRVLLSDETLRPQSQLTDQALRVGDQIKIANYHLVFRYSSHLHVASLLARRFGLSPSSSTQVHKNENLSLAQFVRELMLLGASGELRLSSGLKSGAVFFDGGLCVHAISGSVMGQKALFRMWGWEQPKWRFNSDKVAIQRSVSIGLVQYEKNYRQWSELWRKVSHFLPPPHLKLRAVPEEFLKRRSWSVSECKVLATICEYSLVRDILNYCRLDDVAIIESLIQMRRQGLIAVVS